MNNFTPPPGRGLIKKRENKVKEVEKWGKGKMLLYLRRINIPIIPEDPVFAAKATNHICGLYQARLQL